VKDEDIERRDLKVSRVNWQAVKVRAAQEGRSMFDVANKLLEQGMKK
jgi:plasmid stability protein